MYAEMYIKYAIHVYMIWWEGLILVLAPMISNNSQARGWHNHVIFDLKVLYHVLTKYFLFTKKNFVI